MFSKKPWKMASSYYASYDAGPFGHSLPNEVSFTSKLLSGGDIIDDDQLKTLVFMICNQIKLNKFSRLEYVKYKLSILDCWQSHGICDQLNLTGHDFDLFWSGMYKLVHTLLKHIHHHPSANELISDVIKHSKCPSGVVAQIVEQISSMNLENQLALTPHATGNRLISMKWHLDVIIFDERMTKIMEPVVIIELIIAVNGDKHGKSKRVVFQCRLQQFHQLRFVAACMGKELAKADKTRQDLIK